MENSTVVVIAIIIISIILIWVSQGSPNIKYVQQQSSCPPCAKPQVQYVPVPTQQGPINVNLNNEDPFSDAIKRQDEYMLNDPLSYPNKRLDRATLQAYQDYYNKNGVNPPFNYHTQPWLLDNPIVIGYLSKMDQSPYEMDDVPASIPLMMLKSPKSNIRFFYYIVDQRHRGDIPVKVPFDDVTINGTRYRNADEN